MAMTDSSQHARRSRGASLPALVPMLQWERRTALVGVLATAVTFGPARMAYGMLLPSLREAFGMTASVAGAIASASFAAFAVALVLASLATRLLGAKLPVVAGGALALVGAATVALATNTVWMATGVILAAASAGLCWTPFNAVAGRLVRARRRDRVLSIVSTGTTLGIALMAGGALALAWTGASWRTVWMATAASGALVAGLAFTLLPPSGRLIPRHPPNVPRLDARAMMARLAKRAAWPTHALAFLFGAASAVFSTFAVDHVAGSAGGDALTVGGLVFLAFGIVGAVGFAGDAIERGLGMRGALAACFAALMAGAAALALMPAAWPVVLAGAGLVGAGSMVFCVLLAVATMRLFPALPVMGFTLAVVAMSLGSVAGPALAGWLADAHGTGATLLAGAAVAAGAALLSLAPGVAPGR